MAINQISKVTPALSQKYFSSGFCFGNLIWSAMAARYSSMTDRLALFHITDRQSYKLPSHAHDHNVLNQATVGPYLYNYLDVS